MSEVDPNVPPLFPRRLPEAVSNDRVNEFFREAIREAIEEERENEFASEEEFGEAVAKDFYDILGSGAIVTTIQEEIADLPSRYVADTSVHDTALQYVDRVDYQSHAHPAILSPLIALMGPDGGPYYVGTDKLAHLVQQGYDYWFIYKNVEKFAPGMGELYASAWGLWSEGIELTDEYVGNYLTSHGLPFGAETVSRIRGEVTSFMEDSELIWYLNPTPDFVEGWVVTRWMADQLGTHQFGVLGDALTGIISYSDIVVNEAGLRFYFDLIEDPEGMARNFDIADYVTPEWDEEILPSTFSPLIQERIEEAEGNGIKWPFVYGFGLDLSVPPWMLSLSFPVLYYEWRDIEWRARLGGSIPLTIDESALARESRGFVSLDMDMRITGLHFAYLTSTFAFTEAIASNDPMDGFHPIIEMGWEIMFWGWTSLRMGFMFDINDYVTSFTIGILRICR